MVGSFFLTMIGAGLFLKLFGDKPDSAWMVGIGLLGAMIAGVERLESLIKKHGES